MSLPAIAAQLPKYTIGGNTINAGVIIASTPVDIVGDPTGVHFAIVMQGTNNQVLASLVAPALVAPHIPVPGDYHKIDQNGVVSIVPKVPFLAAHTLQ